MTPDSVAVKLLRNALDVLELPVGSTAAIFPPGVAVTGAQYSTAPKDTRVSRVLATAIAEIGVTESPEGSNKTKYGAWYGKAAGSNWDGQAWCGMFVSWVFAHAGEALPALQAEGFSGFASAAIGMDACKQCGWEVASPAPGDLVFYSLGGKRIDHVGIVERVEPDGRIVAIEGNTGSPSISVMRRTRDRSVCRMFARVR